MTIAVTDEKMKSLTSQSKTTMESPQITIRQLGRTINIMTSMTPAVLPAPLHYRALQELKNTALDHHHSYFSQITPTQEVKQDLMWRRTYLRQWKSWSILLKRALLTLESDDSDLGCGAVCLNQKTQQEVYGIHTDDSPHQLQGASCSLTGAPILRFNPTGCTHTSSDRQHSSSGLCEQDGRSAFQEPVPNSITGLGLVSLQEPYDFSRAPSGLTESTGRQVIENRFFRMGTGYPD